MDNIHQNVNVLFSERPHKVVVDRKTVVFLYISINSQTSHLCKLRVLFRMWNENKTHYITTYNKFYNKINSYFVRMIIKLYVNTILPFLSKRTIKTKIR